MSIFSDILSRHIAAKSVKPNDMAQYCGLERSFMYKIIKGSRIPASAEPVLGMAEYLRLTPQEKEDFVEAYKISTEGYDNYFRRKAVLELFENFEKYSEPEHLLPPQPLPCLSDSTDTIAVTGKNEIRHLLFHILFLESRRQDAHIRLLIQPDSPFLTELLASIAYRNPTLKMDHIICFNNSEKIGPDKQNYNLFCLKQILPLYSCACLYNVYYYYGTLLDSTGELLLFPYLILTSTHVFLLAKDMQSGIIMKTPEMLSFFSELYEGYLKKVSSLAVRMADATSQIQYFRTLTPIPDHTFSLQMIPCLTYSIPDHFLERYILPEIPNRDATIDLITSHIHRIRKMLEESPLYFIFSLDGIRRFLKTGRIPEYPESIYRAIEPSDRILLVKRFLQLCTGKYLKLLKKNIGDIDNELFMYINQRCGYLLFPSAESGQLICLDITEPSLLFAFSDFCENLDDDLFYSEEETFEILSKLLAEETNHIE
ncbi:hypothetical protein B5F13_02980 [Drancourtella sp. An177]|nr:hypothetical protein B5F13_02980 [Drancourtella sp. An177]